MNKRATALSAVTSLALTLTAGAGTAAAYQARTSTRPLVNYPVATVQASASATTPPVRAAFLGDSYTYGVGASVRTNGYAFLVSQAEHWDSTIVGLPGSGYTRVATKDEKDIAAGIPEVIAAHPQILVVAVGHNDSLAGQSLATTQRNSVKDLSELRAALPSTKIVVVGPIWLNGHPGAKVLKVRQIVHAAQRRLPNSVWIDPIAQHWFTGTFAGRTGDDATMINYSVGHPDNLGYQNIAAHMEADLQSLGVR